MMQIFPILLVVVILLADRGDELSLNPLATNVWTALAVAWLPVAMLIALAWVSGRWCLRGIPLGRGPRRIMLVDRFAPWAQWVALGAFAAAVLLFGWLEVIRGVVGDFVLIDELIAIIPPIIALVGVWWTTYPVQVRVREAALIRRLDQGEPIYPIPGRGRYVLQQLRVHLLLILIPVLVVLGWAEAVDLYMAAFTPDAPIWLQEGLRFAGGLVIFIFAPGLARFILDARSLPAGVLRDELLTLCRAHNVKVRDLLLWNTDGSMINGAVMGLFGRLRYVLLTDALLDSMSRQQIHAVMAHEVGHVRCQHLFWLAAVLVALITTISLVIELPLMLVDWYNPQGWTPATIALVEPTAVAITLAITLLAFGWVCRRFERQADTFAVATLSQFPVSTRRENEDHQQDQQRGSGLVNDTAASLQDARNGSPVPVVTAGGATTMQSALLKVARLNSVDINRPSWRHGTIRWRCEHLSSIIGTPLNRLAVNRQIRNIKVATAVVLATILVLIIWQVMFKG